MMIRLRMSELMLIIAILKTVTGANILLVFPYEGVSHHIVGASLAAGLSESGHKVTLLSPKIYVDLYNLEFNGSPPYDWVKFETFCDPIEKVPVPNQLQYSSLSDYRVDYVPNLEYMIERGSRLSNMTLFDPSTRRLMRTGRFDLVIVEILYTEALLGLGQYFNAPVIAFSVLGMYKQVNDLVGNPMPPSYVPQAFNYRAVGLGSFNTIKKRAYNVLMSFYELFYVNHVHHRLQSAHYWRAFPWSKIEYDQALLGVSLVLSNSHFTTSGTKPIVPTMIEVGGLHLGQSLPIMDEELQKFLDDAKDGFVYISFGGSRRLADMDDKMRRDIVHVINSTPYYVLWQSDIEHFDLPESKHLQVAWVPQQSVLNHANIRLFITHGGLCSMYEALYFKVPIIGIPFTGEQYYYLNHAVNNGWALRLEYKNISLFSLTWAITTATEDLSMKDQAVYANILLRDQMYRPLDKAIHHVNYVLRHGSRQMRSPTINFGFLKYHSLDTAMILFIVIVVLTKIVALVYCLRGGELCKLCQDLVRKYNETFFGSGWQPPQPEQQHTEQTSHRQPSHLQPSNRQLRPTGKREVRKRTARKREDLNFPNISEEYEAFPDDDQRNQPRDTRIFAQELNIGEAIQRMAGRMFDEIVNEAVAIVDEVATEEPITNISDAVAEDLADNVLVAENSTLNIAGDGNESRSVVEEMDDEPQQISVSEDIDKSTGRNIARNKKLRSNRKLLVSRRRKK